MQVTELNIDRDMSKKKILKYLKDYHRSSPQYDNIRKDVVSVGKASPADKLLRHKKLNHANFRLKYSDIEKFFKK